MPRLLHFIVHSGHDSEAEIRMNEIRTPKMELAFLIIPILGGLLGPFFRVSPDCEVQGSLPFSMIVVHVEPL